MKIINYAIDLVYSLLLKLTDMRLILSSRADFNASLDELGARVALYKAKEDMDAAREALEKHTDVSRKVEELGELL